uniref:Uncharacterized protein LOC111120456 n=1 Tax=Crassostrea virginica TaxID=6565 RepID=A0A8B8CLZ9_CRAVI|nr:uncharacterized protein LOC111120456 [Crassostrea virginica]
MATSVSSTGFNEEDRTRFFRLSLIIIDELTQILRDLLYNEIPPTRIFQKVIKVNHLTRTLPKDQIAVLSNANTRGYTDFDITLLYTLLRNVCQTITPPSQNWGVSTMPSPNEVTVGDDVERIRLIRNKFFAHISEAAISETEFKDQWSIISGICTRMQTRLRNDYVGRLQDAEDRSIDTDIEKKCIQLIKRQIEEEATNRDILQKILRAVETIRIKSRVAVKKKVVDTLNDTSISILNEMVNSINKKTSEEDIDELYNSLVEFIHTNKDASENVYVAKMLKKIKKKITSYAKLQGQNQMKILRKFFEFSLMLRKVYGVCDMECLKGSILLRLDFSSSEGYDLYKKDLENGRIGEQILELFCYPPLLESFDLKADDIEISLNGRLLTQPKELTSKEIIEIRSRDVAKIPIVETLINMSISVLNKMVDAVNELTSEADVNQIYDLLAEFMRDNKEPENPHLQNLLMKLNEKIISFAELQGQNQIKILAKHTRFSIRMRREYGAQVEYSKSSILLSVTFSSKEGYDLYKKDLENGQIGEQILELFLYPPFLDSFGLKVDDIDISLNGSLLTQPKGKEDVKHVVMLASCM